MDMCVCVHDGERESKTNKTENSTKYFAVLSKSNFELIWHYLEIPNKFSTQIKCAQILIQWVMKNIKADWVIVWNAFDLLVYLDDWCLTRKSIKNKIGKNISTDGNEILLITIILRGKFFTGLFQKTKKKSEITVNGVWNCLSIFIVNRRQI